MVNSYPVFHPDTVDLVQFRWLKQSVLVEIMESVAILKQLPAGGLRCESGLPG